MTKERTAFAVALGVDLVMMSAGAVLLPAEAVPLSWDRAGRVTELAARGDALAVLGAWTVIVVLLVVWLLALSRWAPRRVLAWCGAWHLTDDSRWAQDDGWAVRRELVRETWLIGVLLLAASTILAGCSLVLALTERAAVPPSVWTGLCAAYLVGVVAFAASNVLAVRGLQRRPDRDRASDEA